MTISDEDIKVTVENPSAKGGQHVGSTRYIVHVTHLPTGISASCGYEKSQHKCRSVCIAMIEYGLAEMRWSKE